VRLELELLRGQSHVLVGLDHEFALVLQLGYLGVVLGLRHDVAAQAGKALEIDLELG